MDGCITPAAGPAASRGSSRDALLTHTDGFNTHKLMGKKQP